MAAEHEIRIWPEWFEDVASGKKPFEVRLNDRDYRAGDALLLREYDPNGLGSYTGRETRKVVTHVLDKPIVGLSPGYVVLGLVEPLPAPAHPQEDAAARVLAAEQSASAPLRASLATAQRELAALRATSAPLSTEGAQQQTKGAK